MVSQNVQQLKQLIGEIPSSEILVKALDEVTSAIIIVDDEAHIYFVNKQAEIFFGYQRLELYGKHVNILLPKRFHKQHIEYIKGFMTDPQTVMVQREMGRGLQLFAIRKDGVEFEVTVDISPTITDQGIFVVATVKKK